MIEPTTTLVLDPGTAVRVSEHGNYVIDVEAGDAAVAVAVGAAAEEAAR